MTFCLYLNILKQETEIKFSTKLLNFINLYLTTLGKDSYPLRGKISRKMKKLNFLKIFKSNCIFKKIKLEKVIKYLINMKMYLFTNFWS